MCPLQDRAGQGSQSHVRGPYNASNESSRWSSSYSSRTLIQIANNKRSLLEVLKEYGIRLSLDNQFDNWSPSIICPFPFHKNANERTPSFGYNFKEDRFNCFGCGSFGRAVEFISLKEGINKTIVAEQIIRESGDYEINDDLDYENENPQIEKLLFECAEFIHRVVFKNHEDSSAINQIEKIIWWFDNYLSTRAPNKEIFVEELSARIVRVYELLEEYDI